jgi:hypothetical protein
MKLVNVAIAAVVALAFAPAAEAQVIVERDITLRGCVVPGIERGTFALTQTREVVKGQPAVPATMQGRHVVFWLDDASDLNEHVGRMVEVRGEIEDIEESEIEFKAGPRDGGGLIVEFEGPGEDVKVAAEALGGAVGTSGAKPGSADLKTFVIRVDVEDVDAVEGTCVQPTAR